jgi:hypothetical protein
LIWQEASAEKFVWVTHFAPEPKLCHCRPHGPPFSSSSSS